MYKIPIATPIIEKSEIKVVSKVMKSKWISSKGPFIKKFDLEKRPFLKRINEVCPVPQNKIFKLAPRETPVKK